MDRTSVLLFALIGLCTSAPDPGLQCTNPNEEAGCVQPCPGQRTCSSLHFAIPCIPPTTPCTPQCVCVDGFARSSDGNCVTFAQCDECPGYKQHFACDGTYSPDCTGACQCDTGYSPGGNSTCVEDNPPPTVIAPPPPTVIAPPPPIVIAPPPPIVIAPPPPTVTAPPPPTVTSPPPGTDLQCANANEEVGCVLSCPPQLSCRTLHLALPCAPPTQPCTLQCVCVNGFARNVDGICITYEQCDQCPGYTQHFACDGPYSPNCTGTCQCDTGYSRNSNGTCVEDNPPIIVIAPPPPSPPSTPVVVEPPAVKHCPPSHPAAGTVYEPRAPPSPATVYEAPSVSHC